MEDTEDTEDTEQSVWFPKEVVNRIKIGLDDMNVNITLIKSEEEFLEHFGKPNETLSDHSQWYIDQSVPWYSNIIPPSPEIFAMRNKELNCIGVPNTIFNALPYVAPTPMSTDDLKDKLIADLDQERHNMIDAMKENEIRTSNMEYALRCIWLDLCDSYDKKSTIKDVSRETLHHIYHELSVYMTHCSDYADRDLTKKIKREVEQNLACWKNE